ncbi:hypothetical protein [Thermogemmatispora sp.]|uniref:hypothetical protein n=1 Tax=Thermogemmatispora sp. TaxID=1968838 RepID=UPI001D55DA55|nr:hypothetical protein [Thermogemmatispora sp.]MBX5449346.1 hypothetical protein [Thermogemmatispora sp.]
MLFDSSQHRRLSCGALHSCRLSLLGTWGLLGMLEIWLSFYCPWSLSSLTASRAARSPSGWHPLGIRSTWHIRSQATSNNVFYHNGPVMGQTMTAYAIFWEPPGSQVSAGYHQLIERYFQDVGNSALYQNNRQYSDKSGQAPAGATFGGSWIDHRPYPASTLSDAQIQDEVRRALQVQGWTPSLSHMFFVFTARGENICYNYYCSFSSFCAYHGYFDQETIYAVIPYTGSDSEACGVPASPNHDRDADSSINVTSHEQMEGATDPLLTAWYDSQGSEIGDKCSWEFGALDADGGNVSWNGNRYIVQEEWNNRSGGCALSGP